MKRGGGHGVVRLYVLPTAKANRRRYTPVLSPTRKAIEARCRTYDPLFKRLEAFPLPSEEASNMKR